MPFDRDTPGKSGIVPQAYHPPTPPINYQVANHGVQKQSERLSIYEAYHFKTHASERPLFSHNVELDACQFRHHLHAVPVLVAVNTLLPVG